MFKDYSYIIVERLKPNGSRKNLSEKNWCGYTFSPPSQLATTSDEELKVSVKDNSSAFSAVRKPSEVHEEPMHADGVN